MRGPWGSYGVGGSMWKHAYQKAGCQGPIITSSKAWMNMRQCSWIFYWVLSFSFNFLFSLFFSFSSTLRFFLQYSNHPVFLPCFFFKSSSVSVFLSCCGVSEDIESFTPSGNKCSQVIFKSSMSQRLLEFHTKCQKDKDSPTVKQ